MGPPPGQGGPVIAVSELPPVLTRTYKGKPNEVEMLRSVDAEALAKRGYFPTQMTSQPGSRQDGMALAGIVVLIVSWVIALSMPYGRSGAASVGPLLIFGGTGLGLLIIVASVTARRPDTLTVIYQRRSEPSAIPLVASAPPAPPAVQSSSNIEERLATLERLRSSGAITEDELAARRNKILDEI